jgi:hypothetical protein
LWKDVPHNVLDDEFAMHSASPYKTAILTVGGKKHRKSMLIKLPELRYLTYIFPMVQDQLIKYTDAMAVVMNFVLTAIQSSTYVEPSPNSNRNIIYYQLFEEMKTIW